MWFETNSKTQIGACTNELDSHQIMSIELIEPKAVPHTLYMVNIRRAHPVNNKARFLRTEVSGFPFSCNVYSSTPFMLTRMYTRDSTTFVLHNHKIQYLLFDQLQLQ